MWGSCDIFVDPPALRFAPRGRLPKKSQLLLNVNVSAVWGRSSFVLHFAQVVSGASAFFVGVARFARMGQTEKTDCLLYDSAYSLG
ncbi:hypothetical protein IJT10_05420 [bacterium]|nr:hypothetical protein [bacterium]